MVQESGHLDLSTQSYGQLNKHYLFGHFPGPDFLLSGFRQILRHFRLVFWAKSLQKKCGLMSLVPPPISLTPIKTTQVNLLLSKHNGLKFRISGT